MMSMADFFDKLMKDAKKTAAKVADRTVATANIAKSKTLETVDLVKLEIEIKKVQGDLDQEYQVLGQIIYQIEKGVLNRDDQIVQASCNRIDRCKKRLEDWKAKRKAKRLWRKKSMRITLRIRSPRRLRLQDMRRTRKGTR